MPDDPGHAECCDARKKAEAQLDRAVVLLRSIAQWDQMNPPMTGDHGAWKRAIDAFLASLEQPEEGGK